MRAYCHIHGGDHQRSLSIAVDGDAAGYGYCHTCHVAVFVPEFAPTDSKGPRVAHPRQWTAEALLRPPRRYAPGEPTPQGWQRAELDTLLGLDARMRARLTDARPREYLAARHIPFEIAEALGVGYVPADARLTGHMAKWRDRLIFPLGSPAGCGYAGRSLWGWQPGIDENAHKVLLDAEVDREQAQAEAAQREGHSIPIMHRRWEKTYPAGWFGYGELASAKCAVIVEGPVDALALLAAGMEGFLDSTDALVPVVALVGTAGHADWIPDNVSGLLLALDGDKSGSEAARGHAFDLGLAGLRVAKCAPPIADGNGKDWAERWRRMEYEGVWSVFDMLDTLLPAEILTTEKPGSQAESASTYTPSLAADASGLHTEALADAVVLELIRLGYRLTQVTALA